MSSVGLGAQGQSRGRGPPGKRFNPSSHYRNNQPFHAQSKALQDNDGAGTVTERDHGRLCSGLSALWMYRAQETPGSVHSSESSITCGIRAAGKPEARPAHSLQNLALHPRAAMHGASCVVAALPRPRCAPRRRQHHPAPSPPLRPPRSRRLRHATRLRPRAARRTHIRREAVEECEYGVHGRCGRLHACN